MTTRRHGLIHARIPDVEWETPHEPHFPSQGSIVLSEAGGVVLVVNAGSDDVSMFAAEAGALTLTDRASSGGSQPVSLAVAGDLVYVLNNATPNVVGYRISDERLHRIDGSARPLGGAHADPAQVAFSPDGATLAVTERGTDSISTFAVDGSGLVSGPRTIPASGRTPYGFAFTRQGAMVVTEAFGGAVGLSRATAADVAAGERLLLLAPAGIAEFVRAGGYRPKEYVHEMIAEIYATLMARRGRGETRQPIWLSDEIYELVQRVCGWNP